MTRRTAATSLNSRGHKESKFSGGSQSRAALRAAAKLTPVDGDTARRASHYPASVGKPPRPLSSADDEGRSAMHLPASGLPPGGFRDVTAWSRPRSAGQRLSDSE